MKDNLLERLLTQVEMNLDKRIEAERLIAELYQMSFLRFIFLGRSMIKKYLISLTDEKTADFGDTNKI